MPPELTIEERAALMEMERRGLTLKGRTEQLDFSEPPHWFHDYQIKAWGSASPITAICAAWQSGKTVFLPFWLKREIQIKGPGDYGAFSSTFKLLNRKLLPELKKAFSDVAEFRISDQQFVFTERGNWLTHGPTWDGTPTVIQLGHAENPDSLESATLKAVIWDECGQRLVPKQSFDTVQSRLMVNRGRMCLASRPYESGWFETLVTTPNEDVQVVTFPSWANPVNPPEDDPYWDKIRASMEPWKFTMLYVGRFTMPAGLVYDCYSFELNTCEDFDLTNHDVRLYPGMDFGKVNTAGIAIAEDRSTNILYVIGAYHVGKKRDYPDHVASMRELTKAHAGGQGYAPGCGGNKHGEDGWREAYRKHGLALDEPPDANIDVMIQAVWSAMHQRKLIFFRTAASRVIDDVKHFSYPIDDEGNVIERRADDTKWHLLAALRYIVSKLRPNKKPLDKDAVAVLPVNRYAGMMRR